jgi:hypothetical protein
MGLLWSLAVQADFQTANLDKILLFHIREPQTHISSTNLNQTVDSFYRIKETGMSDSIPRIFI